MTPAERAEVAAMLKEVVTGLAKVEPLLDRKGLADWACCSVRTIDDWRRKGCPHVVLGGPGGSPRFLASEVFEWLQTRSKAG